MTQILGISGKKQSGKDSIYKFLLGATMTRLAIVRGKIHITSTGHLHIDDLFGDEDYRGIFDPDRNNEHVQMFLGEYVHPFLKKYSFADPLKRDVCIRLLGLTYEQCYGSNKDKETSTKLKWEDMPTDTGKTGYMTAREVMQYVGTKIFRKMREEVWTSTTINTILAESPKLAVIPDVRFPDEVLAIQNAGGKVIRLDREVLEDEDESETALDPDKFDWSGFDRILVNHDLDIHETNKEVVEQLMEWKMFNISEDA